MAKPKKKKARRKHGKYVLENNKGFFIYGTLLKRGRAFVGKRVIDIGLKSHRKMCKSIVLKGERHPTVGKYLYKGPDLSLLKGGKNVSRKRKSKKN